MNQIETVMKQGLEELDALHKNRTTPVSRAEFHSWLKAHQKDLLAAVVAEVRGKMDDTEHVCIENDGFVSSECPNGCIDETLQDIETIINKAIIK